MASQSCTTYGKSSVIRGHHVYKAIWTPIVGENLSLQLEEENEHDNHAVVVMSDNTIVGHMPRSLSCFHVVFLEEVDSQDIGSLEIPCMYTYTGSSRMIQKVRRLMKSEEATNSCPL